MQITLSELGDTLKRHGMEAELAGDGSLPIRGVATLEDAVEGEITFLSNPKYEKTLATTRASAVVLKPDVKAPEHLALIRATDPYAAITVAIVTLHGYRQHRPVPFQPDAVSIHPSARIGANASIHPGATIAEDVVIGDDAVLYPACYVGPRCRIGDKLLLYPNVVIYDDAVIGDRVTVHSGTVIGNDGLGYALVDGKWVKIPQIGIVEIGDDVEIGSNCSIDRATLGRTKIGSGSKLSNLIAVGHGTHVGEDCLLVAQVGLAGSVSVGKHVTMAGQAGVVGHIRIGDNATIGAKAGVTNSVPDGETVLGQPAIPIRDMRRRIAYLGRLPELNGKVKRLEKRVAELEAQLNAAVADK
ncbi:MAG: UDP-3-O-(3-hydroxymyristoyl)glucosamine N-acyltransferase [Planctomycetes bacterium]|nr:UDP-3-O-(3-hydroxymyristoyl)glucosamine N-acyltransferase [Planctomycetota bacterium]